MLSESVWRRRDFKSLADLAVFPSASCAVHVLIYPPTFFRWPGSSCGTARSNRPFISYTEAGVLNDAAVADKDDAPPPLLPPPLLLAPLAGLPDGAAIPVGVCASSSPSRPQPPRAKQPLTSPQDRPAPVLGR